METVFAKSSPSLHISPPGRRRHRRCPTEGPRCSLGYPVWGLCGVSGVRLVCVCECVCVCDCMYLQEAVMSVCCLRLSARVEAFVCGWCLRRFANSCVSVRGPVDFFLVHPYV